MCMSCALRDLRQYNEGLEGGRAAVHYGAPSATGFQTATGLTPTGLLVVTADDVPDDISTGRSLEVNGPGVVSTIDTLGDLDFYKVELVAGRAYEFGMFAEGAGPGGVPLIDSLLEIYDADGNLITSADGGASTQLNVVNSGFDAILSFTPSESGTYYINARAFDNVPADGTNGDLVGDYRLTATDVTDLPRYIPYYDAESPLYALDWGSQVDGTVRNPDGAETGHLTGNPAETPDDKGATTGYFGQSTEGKNVIKIYFAKAGDIYTPEDVTQPGLPPVAVAVGAKDFEIAAVWTALGEFEKVADIVYVETQNRDEADFHYVTYTGTPGPGVSLLGSMAPPQETDEGLALFNSGDYRWNATNLAQGGFSFVTLIHEFGHGHGMAHPHDNGGRSGVMRGVEAEGAGIADYGTGAFDLNQGVFTMMSYEDGWQKSPYGNAATDVGYGYLGGLMAFDIAVIQDKYGVNEEWATGDDIYLLKDENAAGTFYHSIWDAGGTDLIAYDGARNASIDLRAATLNYEVGGGGTVSYATGVFGGVTIANGVVIENARGGAGDDVITGNGAANRLDGGAGADRLDGGSGDDVLVGGAGRDTLTGGTGRDQLTFAALADGGVGANRDIVADFADGEDRLALGAVGATGFIGTNLFGGVAGQVNYAIESGATVVRLDADGDGRADLEVELAGTFQLDRLDFVDLVDGALRLVGTGAADTLRGMGGNDVLIGLAGDDLLDGGAGVDTADYSATTAGFRLDLAITGPQKTGAGTDTLTGIENLIGGSGNNQLHGDANGNRLEGRGGIDYLQGRNGDDVLVGGVGADSLDGGLGRDLFVFEAVTDSLRGGGDMITGFARGQDRIDLAQIDADLNSAGLNDAFAFIGTGAFTGSAGQLRYSYSGTATVIHADLNGDKVADLEIILRNKVALTESDFLL